MSEKWFESLKWDKDCLECQAKHEGKCKNRECAEMHYDEWGDPIPDGLYFKDGNNVQKYLEEKRQRMEGTYVAPKLYVREEDLDESVVEDRIYM